MGEFIVNNYTRQFFYIIAALSLLCIFSCEGIVENQNYLDCENLKTGIIELNSEIVISEINKLVTDLYPAITNDDQFGQKENINLLIERVNSQCENINAELLCYACIETNPPQSEILLETEFDGAAIKRVIDISTPGNARLCCVRLHEYFVN